MAESVRAGAVRRALTARLRCISTVLLDDPLPAPGDDPDLDAAVVLDRVVAGVHADLSKERVWLLLVAMTATFPRADMVAATVRAFELSPIAESTLWLLETCLADVSDPGVAVRRLTLAAGAVVVEVDQAARDSEHTGVKQVIRSTLPVWSGEHEITLVAWAEDGTALRTLTAAERARVLSWDDGAAADGDRDRDRDRSETVVAPWRSVLVLPDVAKPDEARRLHSLAADTGNRVVAIGHDCIPVVSADLVSWGLAGRFVGYLSVLKHMRRVAAVSASATQEFTGFVDALPAQGITGPLVFECRLPTPRAEPAAPVTATGSPSVLSVGSFEPRKNHLALLHAAEILWQEGCAFELVLIGGMAWGEEVPARIAVLHARGRAITVIHRAPQSVLDEAYRTARFTVFASLHEGYGLPVAESLAAGVPVITSNFGSTAETAAGGGALTIDPRDDEALVRAMRRLLTDDAELARLRAQIAHRAVRSWADYARELWRDLVQPEHAQLLAQAAPDAGGQRAPAIPAGR